MKNNQIKILLFILIFIYFPTISNCQTEAENLKKYWDYRDRLKKFFLKIGDGPGESIPMENREDGFNTASGKSRVRFGDATIQLGYYIAVLASEYKLLIDAQQFDEAQKTKIELYYSIQAVNRLDFKAEPYLSNNTMAGSYNGFLIRDDVREDFKDNWDNLNGSSDAPWRSWQNVDYLTSEWYDQDNESPPNYHNNKNEMSQDQIISLLMGFAFVNKFVDNNQIRPTAADPYLQLVTEVRQITERIFNYVTPISLTFQSKLSIKLFEYDLLGMHYSYYLPATVPANVDTKENWIILRPNSSELVHRGAEMAGFSYIMADVMRDITNNVTTTPAYSFAVTQTFSIGPIAIPPFNIVTPLGDIGAAWNALQNQALPDISLFNTDLSDVSSNIPVNIHWPHIYHADEINMQMILALAAVGDTWDPSNLNSIVQNSGWRLFGLMNCALNNHVTGITQSAVQYELNIAPCEGPSESGPTSWNSTSRYGHPDNPGNFPGEYNGLDYMLLYNLYQLNYKSSSVLPLYKNTACPCNGGLDRPYLFTDINPITHKLFPTANVWLERKFSDYLNFGNSAPEYLNQDLILDNGNLSLMTELIVCNNSTLEIQNSGLLRIGDIGKLGLLRIKPGSTLILKSGCQIILKDQSQVIVEPGANFIYEPGALIYMQGENTLFDVQTTNVNITINNGEQFYCTRSGFSLIGGTIKFAGGAFNLNAGGNLINDGCKIIMQPAMNFSYQPNSLIQLSQTCSEIRVLNPNTTITIPSGDQFYTTKDGSAEGGLIYFAGGEFDLLAGGTINNDGCKIQLGDGMNLDYYQGSNIDLTGSFAMLYVDGTLHLHPNADFHFNNDGFIKFGLPNAAPNILSDASCTLTFTGQGATDKVLEIADQTDLFLDHTTGLLKIQDAKVELGYQSSVNVANPVDFNHSRFTSANLSYTANGLVFNGQSRLHLDHLDVDYMKYGIRARNFYSDGADFKLTNSAIGYCDYGLQTWDKGASLTNVNVHDCYNWGWQGFGMTRPSPVLLSKFNRTQQFGGVYYEGAGSNLLRISYCEINNNAAVGLAIAGPALATVLCSELKDNLDGNPSFVAVPYVCNAAIQFNASLNFSPLSLSHTLGGYNDFSSVSNPYNTTHSVLSTWGWSNVYSSNNGGAAFYLEGGHNSFTRDADFKFASGTFGQAGNFPGNKLYAKNNQWYANLSPPNSAEYSLTSNSNAHPITISDPTPEYFDGCRMVPVDPNGVDGRPYPLYECPRCPVINSPRFNLVPLNQALLQAIDTTTLADTANGNDLTAFQMLYDISRVCILHDAEDVAFLFKLAYSFMKAAFGSAVKDSLINSVNDPEFSMLAEFQRDLINRAIENDNDYEEYYYTLDRAFSYLAVNDREEALAVLNGLSPCIELTEEQYAFLDHWKNLVNVENNILTGQQSIFDFDSLLEAGGNGYGSRMFFTGTKANIDTIMFDSIPFPAVQSLQSITDNNGNVYTVSAQADSSMNYLLTRTDSLSQVLWSYPYDGRNHDSDIVKALCVDGLGNIYVTGKSWNRDNFEVTTVKFDSAGNQYWTAVYNSPDYLNDEPTGMEINPDGKLVITGKSSNDTIERFFRIEYSQCDTFCLPGYRSATQPPETSIEFSLSPNPVTDGYLRIDYKLQEKENGQFEIYDLAGRQLYRLLLQPNSTSQHIKLPISANGIYYAEVASGGKKISRKLAVLLE